MLKPNKLKRGDRVAPISLSLVQSQQPGAAPSVESVKRLVTRMDFGHTDPLPYGVLAQIDCNNGRFEILENAVVDRVR
jgi:muramoyltetrapeptide carboxypeptidase LdcA involved in peptidoglycan recycling